MGLDASAGLVGYISRKRGVVAIVGLPMEDIAGYWLDNVNGGVKPQEKCD